jgi:hypothetical protein
VGGRGFGFARGLARPADFRCARGFAAVGRRHAGGLCRARRAERENPRGAPASCAGASKSSLLASHDGRTDRTARALRGSARSTRRRPRERGTRHLIFVFAAPTRAAPPARCFAPEGNLAAPAGALQGWGALAAFLSKHSRGRALALDANEVVESAGLEREARVEPMASCDARHRSNGPDQNAPARGSDSDERLRAREAALFIAASNRRYEPRRLGVSRRCSGSGCG